MEGWIKLHRKTLENSFCENNCQKLGFWTLLLLKANHKEIDIFIGEQKVHLQAGQFITSRKTLAFEASVQQMKIERLLKCLESEHQIEQQTYSKFRLITINNWNQYQQNEQQNEQQMNNKRTTNEQQMNTDKNVKNDNNVNKFIIPTLEEIKKEIQEKSYNVDAEKFRAFYESNGWRVGKNPMKSWKACLITWNKTNSEPKREIKLPKNIL